MTSHVPKAIALGGLTAAGCNFLSIGLGFAVMAVRSSAPASLDTPSFDSLATGLSAAPTWQLLGTIGTFVATLIGGYVAAAVARERIALVGLLSIWLTALLGARSLMSPTRSLSALEVITLLVAHGVIGIAGAYLWRARQQPSRGSGASLADA